MLTRLTRSAMRQPLLQKPSAQFVSSTSRRLSPPQLSPFTPPLRSHLSSQARTGLSTLRAQTPSAFLRQPSRTHATGPRQTYRTFGGGSRINTFARLWGTSAAFQRTVYIGAGGVVLAIALNVEQVPGSGRWRFNFVSPELEAQMSSAQYEQLRQQFAGHLLPPSSREVRRVRRVLERLQPHSGLANAHAEWTVDVIAANEANAFVIPGGHVFVFAGLLPICQDDDGLATVLGHEIAHTTAHHAAEQMSRGAGLAIVAVLSSLIFDVSGALSQSVLDIVVNRPGSRVQEREADHLGLLMMARACYDPSKALDFWARMQAADKHGQPPALLSTHPSHGSRVKAIQDWLPDAMRVRDDEGSCGAVGEYAGAFQEAVGAWNFRQV